MKCLKEAKWNVPHQNFVDRFILIVVCFLFLFSAKSHSILTVDVSYTNSPLQIQLTWNSQGTGSTIQIYRRILGDESSNIWVNISNVENPTLSYIDNSIVNAVAYEYKLVSATNAANAAYVAAGLNIPAVENRGTILMVVDNTISLELTAELLRLEQDMRGDGWKVIRYNSARHASGTPENLKAWIKSQYSANPTEIKSLLLFGHLPICMSGYSAPDGHDLVPLPTDLFYADMDGSWTDLLTNKSTIGYPNIPGDGIYDQNTIPGNNRVEMQVGRVDFSGMTAFSTSEVELLRNYLNKDHYWRYAIIKTPLKGIAGNGYLPMETSCVNSLFGSSNVVNGTFSNSNENKYTWAVDFGDANGVNYPSFIYKSTFYINFGSHKQKFEQNNNQMRALLCLPDYGLTCAWGSRPFWFFHHMGVGETIGYSAFRTQNNGSRDYKPACSYSFQGGIWNNLMGDPTLRMHNVTPASNLKATTNLGSVNLSWTESSDANSGYSVYRSISGSDNFIKINSEPILGNTFTDAISVSNTKYMVRAVKLEPAATGSYYNLSQGIFIDNPESQIVDILAPTIPTRLRISNYNVNGFTLTWDQCTDETSEVIYDVTINGTTVGSTSNTNFDLQNLTANLQYAIAVKAKDEAGNYSVSKVLNTTLDTQTPSVPTNLTATSITTRGFNLSWTASIDNVEVIGYDIFVNGLYYKSTTKSNDLTAPNTFIAINGSEISGLKENEVFAVTVIAKDASGNVSTMSSVLNGVLDTQKPTAPINITASNIIDTGFTLNWTASTDNVAVTGYYTFLNGGNLKTITKPSPSAELPTSVTYSGLKANTTYSIILKATDAVGNISESSSAFSLTTFTGLNKLDAKEIVFSPNPITDELNILLNNQALSFVSICNINGKIVLKRTLYSNANGKIVIDVKHIKSGTYMVTVENENKKYYGKFFKK